MNYEEFKDYKVVIEKEYQVKFFDEDKAEFLLLDFIDEKEYQKYKQNNL